LEATGKPKGGVRKASGVGRGIVKQKKGERAGGDANIAAAKAPHADIAEKFVRYDVK
jgi:hypothetical protein